MYLPFKIYIVSVNPPSCDLLHVCAESLHLFCQVHCEYLLHFVVVVFIAIVGVDFRATPVMAVFSNGNSEHCITIETLQNTSSDNNKTLSIALNLTDQMNKLFLPAPVQVTLVPLVTTDTVTMATTASVQTATFSSGSAPFSTTTSKIISGIAAKGKHRTCSNRSSISGLYSMTTIIIAAVLNPRHCPLLHNTCSQLIT